MDGRVLGDIRAKLARRFKGVEDADVGAFATRLQVFRRFIYEHTFIRGLVDELLAVHGVRLRSQFQTALAAEECVIYDVEELAACNGLLFIEQLGTPGFDARRLMQG